MLVAEAAAEPSADDKSAGVWFVLAVPAEVAAAAGEPSDLPWARLRTALAPGPSAAADDDVGVAFPLRRAHLRAVPLSAAAAAAPSVAVVAAADSDALGFPRRRLRPAPVVAAAVAPAPSFAPSLSQSS